eukprot:TRINITY_DN10340_c0_g1_i1.p1 TRINITY_DN10340_c0_g1~~TRINITY_DN10340_c0_g1_i1.p1  ORF type:complete len:237 (+),score=33.56 TRINITY_DN10340_c0_g1_i1:1061-1771(+)
MAGLVSYSSSDGEGDETAQSAAVVESIATPIRTFGHVEGVWASCICYKFGAEHDLQEPLKQLQRATRAALASHVHHVQTIPQFHASLTRTMTLQHCYLNSFEQQAKAVCSMTPSFSLRLGKIGIFTNETRTRSFAALGINSTAQSRACIQTLIESFDDLCVAYDQLPFYPDRKLHISLCAWSHRDSSEADLKRTEQLLLPVLETVIRGSGLTGEQFVVDQLTLQTGDKETMLLLVA